VADNVTLNPGSGGDTIWADDLGTSKVQGVKVLAGGDAVAQMGATFKYVPSTGTNADKTEVKASAGVLYGVVGVNVGASDCYLQVFNVASGSVTVGSTTPNLVVPLLSTGGVSFPIPIGAQFDTAITVALTTTPTGSTSVTAAEAFVTLLYA